MMKRDILSITDLSREDIYEILESAADLKEKRNRKLMKKEINHKESKRSFFGLF